MKTIEKFFANVAESPTLQAEIASSCGEKKGEDRLKALMTVAKSHGFDANIDETRAYVSLLAKPNELDDSQLDKVAGGLVQPGGYRAIGPKQDDPMVARFGFTPSGAFVNVQNQLGNDFFRPF